MKMIFKCACLFKPQHNKKKLIYLKAKQQMENCNEKAFVAGNLLPCRRLVEFCLWELKKSLRDVWKFISLPFGTECRNRTLE